ncbi:MAG: DNA repair protein RecO [Anaerolineales bacterium]|nr:DNA repair protein RecO [Anaerolineales bacterium]
MPGRERSISDEGVVLRHSNWGEADRLLWIYTLSSGKMRAVAKGARKIRSRKAGHLEPFTRVRLLMAKTRDLPIITQAESIDGYWNLREDLLRVGYASYIVELLDRFTYDQDENRQLYRLLVETLDRLNTNVEPILAVRFYEIRLLDLLGYRPQLFHCARCKEEIQAQNQFFSNNLGGVLCPDCGLQTVDAVPVSMAALKYLRHFQRSSFEKAAIAHLTQEINNEIERLIQNYMTYNLERGLNTPTFLRLVRK